MKNQMLLAYLALEGGGGVPRDKLANALWADRGEEQARHSLRQCLFTLTKSAGEGDGGMDGGADGGPVVADRHEVSLNPGAVHVDIWHFDHLLAEDTPEAMARAVALYGDDLLTGIGLEDDALAARVAAERTRYREICYETLSKLSSRHGDAARLDQAIGAARRLVELDPLREDGHRTLMRLYGRAGRRAEGIKQYRHCTDLLRAELGVAPEEATQNLFAEIRGQNREPNTRTDVEADVETDIETDVETGVADPVQGDLPSPVEELSETPIVTWYGAVPWKTVTLAVVFLVVITLTAAVFRLAVGS